MCWQLRQHGIVKGKMSNSIRVITLGDNNTITSQAMPELTLDYLQSAVKGYVQAIELRDVYSGITMWINEEGKFDDSLSLNHGATFIWEQSFGAGTDFIVGNAVFTGGADDEGNTLGLSAEQQSMVLSSLLLANSMM